MDSHHESYHSEREFQYYSDEDFRHFIFLGPIKASPYSRLPAIIFPIRTSRTANNIHVVLHTLHALHERSFMFGQVATVLVLSET